MKKGIAYCVGIGPGDPELMTLKAVRLIRENDVIAIPAKEAKTSVAYQIAVQGVPELAEKELLPLYMPMVKERERMQAYRQRNAAAIESYLVQGRNVVYLTLGDPAIYCTFSYLQRLLEDDGYPVEMVSGVSSICASAARMGVPLCEWNEQLHIIPAAHEADRTWQYPGSLVLMKSASRMKEIKQRLRESGRNVYAVANCGMAKEQCYQDVDNIPDDAGYFMLIIAKEKNPSGNEPA